MGARRGEESFEVLWPLGRLTADAAQLNPRLGDGAGKRIGFVWDYMFQGDMMFELLAEGLGERFPGSSFVPYTAFGNIHGHDEREVLAALPGKLRAERVDAVITGIGA